MNKIITHYGCGHDVQEPTQGMPFEAHDSRDCAGCRTVAQQRARADVDTASRGHESSAGYLREVPPPFVDAIETTLIKLAELCYMHCGETGLREVWLGRIAYERLSFAVGERMVRRLDFKPQTAEGRVTLHRTEGLIIMETGSGPVRIRRAE